MWWRRAAVGLFCVCIVGLGPASAWADTLQTYQQRERQVERRLALSQQTYAAARAAWQAAHERTQALEADLIAAAGRLRALAQQTAVAQKDLEAHQTAAQAAKVREAGSRAAADQADLALYTQGRVHLLDVLLGANGFADLFTRAVFLERIWRSDLDLLRHAQTDQQLAEEHAAAASAALADLESLRQRAVASEAVLRTELKDTQVARHAEEVAVAQAQAAVRQLVSEKAGLETAIAHLLAQLKSGHLSWPQLVQMVEGLARRFGLDPRLVEAVILQESGGDPTARSSVGALGLMQLMPGTAASLGVKNPLDPQQNLEGGMSYLLQLLQQFKGNLKLALAAYNAGPGAVKRYGGVPPYAETQRYVQDVLQIYRKGGGANGPPG